MKMCIRDRISVVLGVLLGAVSGWLLGLFFEAAFARRRYVRNSTKVIVILGLSFLFLAIENALDGVVPVSGLLAVVSMACVLKRRSVAFVSKRLSEKFGKLWIAAELLLFVLVGAAVDVRYTVEAGAAALLMILISLLLRSLGVALCALRTPLTGCLLYTSSGQSAQAAGLRGTAQAAGKTALLWMRKPVGRHRHPRGPQRRRDCSAVLDRIRSADLHDPSPQHAAVVR